MDTFLDKSSSIPERKGLRRKDLAHAADISVATIHHPKGQQELHIFRANLVADSLNADLKWLIRSRIFEPYKKRLQFQELDDAQAIQNSVIHVGGDFIIKIFLAAVKPMEERQADYKMP